MAKKNKTHWYEYVWYTWLLVCMIVGGVMLGRVSIKGVYAMVTLPSRVAALEDLQGVNINPGTIVTPGDTGIIRIIPVHDDVDNYSDPIKEFKCEDEGMRAWVDVKIVEKFDNEGIMGQYDPSKQEIALASTTIETISHEVSHFVDHTMQGKGLVGTETEAYLQGYFTQCVYEKSHE